MLLILVVLWILAILPLRFGLPWSSVSFASGYGAILMTAVMAVKLLQVQRQTSPIMGQPNTTVRPCSTCETFSEFTENFADATPKVEALYMEHLVREHHMEP